MIRSKNRLLPSGKNQWECSISDSKIIDIFPVCAIETLWQKKTKFNSKSQAVRDCCQISLLTLREIKRINQLLFHLKLSGFLMISWGIELINSLQCFSQKWNLVTVPNKLVKPKARIYLNIPLHFNVLEHSATMIS